MKYKLCFKNNQFNLFYYAWQKSAVNNLISLISNLIPILHILIDNIGTGEEKLIQRSYIHVLTSSIPLIIFTISAFRSPELRTCSPKVKAISIGTTKSKLTLGSNFLIVQAGFLIIINTNELIITSFFDLTNMVEFRIYNSIFTIVGSIFILAISPVWSSVTKAFA